MFTGAGEAAILACANVAEGFPHCSSTTWIYSRNREAAVEEVTLGKVRPENTLIADRLNLLSSCSLHITSVITEDAGFYTCRQYEREGGRQIRDDASVELAVLTSTCDQSDSFMTLKCFIMCILSSIKLWVMCLGGLCSSSV